VDELDENEEKVEGGGGTPSPMGPPSVVTPTKVKEKTTQLRGGEDQMIENGSRERGRDAGRNHFYSGDETRGTSAQRGNSSIMLEG